jgi:molybdate transport system substrate-binding protein
MIGGGANMRIHKPPSWLAAVRRFAASPPFAYIPDRKARSLRVGEEPAGNESRVPNRTLSFLSHAWAKRMSGRRLLGLSSMATRHILADLAQAYESQIGVRVEIRSMGGVEAAKLVRASEATDVVVLASKVMASLEAEGHLAKGGTKDFARSEIGIAVRAGSELPSVANERAVKQAMLDARMICYSTGPSGDHLKALCEKWGVPLARTLVAPPGVPVAALVANGEADLGFQQLSELIGQPGIEIVGPLPPEIQAVTIFAAGVSIKSRDDEGARALVAYLASVETAGAKRRHGLEPA